MNSQRGEETQKGVLLLVADPPQPRLVPATALKLKLSEICSQAGNGLGHTPCTIIDHNMTALRNFQSSYKVLSSYKQVFFLSKKADPAWVRRWAKAFFLSFSSDSHQLGWIYKFSQNSNTNLIKEFVMSSGFIVRRLSMNCSHIPLESLSLVQLK